MTSKKSKILIDKKDIPLFYHLCRNIFHQEVDNKLIELKSDCINGKILAVLLIIFSIVQFIGLMGYLPNDMAFPFLCCSFLIYGILNLFKIPYHYYRSKFNKTNDLSLLFHSHNNDNLIDITEYYKTLETYLSKNYSLNSNVDFYLSSFKNFNGNYILNEEILNNIIFNIDLLNKYSHLGFNDNDEIIASIINAGYQKHGVSYFYTIQENPFIYNQYLTLCKNMEYLFNFSMPNGVIFNIEFIVNYQIMLDINRYLEQSILLKEKNPLLTWNLSNECLTKLEIESFLSTNNRIETLEFLLQEIKHIFEQNKMEIMGKINQMQINNVVSSINNDSTVSTKNDIYCYN